MCNCLIGWKQTTDVKPYLLWYIAIIIIIIIIIIISRYQHGYPWPSLATPPYRPTLPAGLHGYIPYRHRAAVCRSELKNYQNQTNQSREAVGVFYTPSRLENWEVEGAFALLKKETRKIFFLMDWHITLIECTGGNVSITTKIDRTLSSATTSSQFGISIVFVK